MKDLNPVFLTEFIYPCVEYCLRRTGLSAQFSIQQFLGLTPVPFALSTELSLGDILIWRNLGDTDTDAMISINTHGVITQRFSHAKHYAVYEGDGYFSDLIHDGSTWFPRIRVMPMDQKPCPYEFLKLKPLLSTSKYSGLHP